MEEKQNKGCARGCLVFGLAAIALVALVIFLLSISGGKETSKPAATRAPAAAHIYDNAKIITLMSGSGTEVVGKCSVVKAASSDVTEAALTDWYFNHVEPGDYNYAIIVYTDKANTGVYGNKGVIEKDVGLHPEKDGSYYLGSEDNAVIYYASDGKLTKLEDDAGNDSENSVTVEECIRQLDAALKENFKELGDDVYELKTEGTVTTILLSTDGIAQDAMLAAAGNADAVAAWNNLVESMKVLSMNSREIFDDGGHSECSTVVQVMNDLDKTKMLLAVSREVVLYDVVNGINLLG